MKYLRRFTESVIKPEKRYPVDYKCLDINSVAGELEKLYDIDIRELPNDPSNYSKDYANGPRGSENLYSFFGDSQDPIFPKPTMADRAYEYQTKEYAKVGMKAKKWRYCEQDAVYELPVHHDTKLDEIEYVKRFNAFNNTMRDTFKKLGKKWDAETNNKHVNFGSKTNGWVNIALDKIYELYKQHYENDKIKIWVEDDGESYGGKEIFDYPMDKAYFLSDIEKWIEDTFSIDTNGLYEWILDCQYIEGRYWQRTWEYEMEDINFKKHEAPENIKKINEILRQMYKTDKMEIFIDYYKNTIV